MRTRKRPLMRSVIAVLPIFFADAVIPGNILYDGDGEVCWLGRSPNAYNDVLASLLGDLQPINNPLISNFSTVGDVELQPNCPRGTSLSVFPTQDLGEFGAVTQHNYSFTVNGTLDLREWPSDLIVTDDDNAMEAVIHVSASEKYECCLVCARASEHTTHSLS